MLRPSISSTVIVFLSIISMMIVAVTPRDAEACSCGAAPLERTTAQFDGAEDFPTTGVVRVFFSGGFVGYSTALRRAVADEYRLVDESGQIIALEFLDVVRTRLDMRPEVPLEPDTEYTVERLLAHDENGARVSDQSRWSSDDLRNSPRRGGADDPLRYAWSAETSFRTAAEDIERTEIKPQITQSRMNFAYNDGDCGPAISINTNFDLPQGVRSTDIIELEIQGQGVGVSKPAFDNGPKSPVSQLLVSDMLCNPDKVTVDYSPSLQVRVSIRDASGEIMGRSDWVIPEERSRHGFVEELNARPRASDDEVEFDQELWQEPTMLDVEEGIGEEAVESDLVRRFCLAEIKPDVVFLTLFPMLKHCESDASERANSPQ